MKNHFFTTIILGLVLVVTPLFFSGCEGIVIFNVPCSADVGSTIPIDIRIKRDEHHITFTGDYDYSVFIYLSKDQYYDPDDIPLNKVTGSNLFKNSYADRSFTCTIPNNILPGEYFLIAIPNSSALADEPYLYTWVFGTAKGTNVYSRRIIITGNNNFGADLAITNTHFNNSQYDGFGQPWGYYNTKYFLPGANIKVNMSIENRGNTDAGYTHVHAFLSPDRELSNNDIDLTDVIVPPINAYDQAEVIMNMNMPDVDDPGTYYIIISSDHLNQLGEVDENDNIVAREIIVPTARLIINNAYIPALVFTETTIEVEATIVNPYFKSRPSKGKIYLSKDNILDNMDDFMMEFAIPPVSSNYDYAGQIILPDSVGTGEYHLLFEVKLNLPAGIYPTGGLYFPTGIYPVRFFAINYDGFNSEDPCEEIESVMNDYPTYFENSSLSENTDLGHKIITAPNPAADYFDLNYEFPEDAENVVIELFGMNGKAVSQLRIPKINAGPYNQRVSVDFLPNGTYVVSLRYGDTMISEKIIVD